MKTLNILLRTCEGVKNVGSSGRPFNLDKRTIILKCLKSILESCRGFEKRVRLDIIDDSSSEDFIKKMDSLLKSCMLNYQIHKTSFANNGLSLEYLYKTAEKSRADLLYVCSDDYFHLKPAIASILDAYDSRIIFSSDFMVFPADYPRDYAEAIPTLLFIGKYNHWRAVKRTDGVMIIPKKLFLKYRDVFFEFARFNIKGHGGERETINKLTEKCIPCIAPVESLAAHLHKTSLPYLVDWKKEINKIKI